MPLDHYITLGNSGLRVSPFCLGTMTFGEEWGWGATEAVSKQIIDGFIDKGGNFLDTANVYTKGHSEKIIGDNLGRQSSRRDRVVIATKFFGNMYSGDPNGGGAGRKSLTAACENSLRRLQSDYIDLYWMHCWDPNTPIDETMRALDDLVAAGKVRYIGFSDTPAWKVTQAQMTAQFRGWSKLIALQLEYSLLERSIEGELVPAAQELGMGITPWSPLRYGMLTGKYTRENYAASNPERGTFVTRAFNDDAFKVVDVVLKVAKEIGTTPARVALSWIQKRPGVASPIFGARTLQQLDDNLGALDVQLSAAQVAELEEVSRPKLNFPYEFVRNSAGFNHSGATVNGVTAPLNPLTPRNDAERF